MNCLLNGPLPYLQKKPCQLPKKVPMLQDEVVQRRFEPHQQMIHVGRVEKGRNQRSVVTFMEKAGGPMAQLQKWLADRARVKVLVRKNHGVRGSATGILRLFDRHWNLILTDVEEVYQRKKFRYGNEACAAGTTTEEMALSRLRELGLQHPLRDAIVSSVAKKKKLVEVKRKHPLLFIKGDQVAVVFHDVHDAK